MKTGDQIVYVVLSNNEVDVNGDRSSKVIHASFSHDDAKKYKTPESRIEKEVINIEESREQAIKHLSPIDLLVLGLDRHGMPAKPETTYRGVDNGPYAPGTK